MRAAHAAGHSTGPPGQARRGGAAGLSGMRAQHWKLRRRWNCRCCCRLGQIAPHSAVQARRRGARHSHGRRFSPPRRENSAQRVGAGLRQRCSAIPVRAAGPCGDGRARRKRAGAPTLAPSVAGRPPLVHGSSVCARLEHLLDQEACASTLQRLIWNASSAAPLGKSTLEVPRQSVFQPRSSPSRVFPPHVAAPPARQLEFAQRLVHPLEDAACRPAVRLSACLGREAAG